jgi:hypothetical protein
LLHILQVQLRIVDKAAVLELVLCTVKDFVDWYASSFYSLNYFLPMHNLERLLDIKKELMSSNLHLPILHTELTLYLIGLVTRDQAATFVTEAAVRTFLAAFVLLALLNKVISRDKRVFSA